MVVLTLLHVHVGLVHVCGGHPGHMAGFGGGAEIAAIHVSLVHVCGGHPGHVAGFSGSADIAAIHVRPRHNNELNSGSAGHID